MGTALIRVLPGHFARCVHRSRTDSHGWSGSAQGMLMRGQVYANERITCAPMRGVTSMLMRGHVYVNEAVTCALICTRTGGKGVCGV